MNNKQKTGHFKIKIAIKTGRFKIKLEDKKLKLKSVYDIIPAELNKQNKKFVFSMLDKELNYEWSF